MKLSDLNPLQKLTRPPLFRVDARPYPYFWTVLSALMSWSLNHSVWWAILHGLIPIFYIPYWIIKYTALADFIFQNIIVK